ncbi:MAG: galactose oxidase, partial [Cyanobium sp.]
MDSRLRHSSPEPSSGRLEQPVEAWPYLDQQQLQPSRSRKVCMTFYWFRHHAGVNCIPVLTCQLHQGLIAHGEHLTSR